ncbi:RNA polymerase sigma factor YlaC [termite gut metagenome]|jgi:RNA polymerase sigma-70 factor (ECF subfamily)|uniref:RNA polymerase sigma factor YlaC n=1 Tax=termite gut metagenome TaxID=433724 RepID=A0A5J4SIB4_9ZZZZ
MKSVDNDFLKMLSQYQGIVHKVNLVYFNTSDDRKDNFQEIVYQLWKSFPSLKDETKIGSWIYAVAINVSISKIRKDSKYVFTDSIPEIVHTDDTNMFEQDMDFQRLLEAIRHFNETDKSIMFLYLEEYSYKEIAEIIGISASNVGVKIHRLISKLQKQLKG